MNQALLHMHFTHIQMHLIQADTLYRTTLCMSNSAILYILQLHLKANSDGFMYYVVFLVHAVVPASGQAQISKQAAKWAEWTVPGMLHYIFMWICRCSCEPHSMVL
jgi:hypothetical protein